MSKIALITGITGQDGAYLADLLLKKGYQVHGLRQPVAMPDMDRLDSVGATGKIHLHYGDMLDANSITNLIQKVNPSEIYNLAAQSHVHISFDAPDLTLQVNGAGAVRILDSIHLLGLAERVKFFQASTSELFGDASPPQHETTRMSPRSPYAAAKLYSFHMTKIYREAYGLHASNGIMFNHESPLRGGEFVTRKIAMAVAEIINGDQDVLMLGNLDACRDWSHARDIMQGAWLMLQQEEPDDYVLASGQAHTVRDFATEAFAVAGIRLDWHGAGLHETAVDAKSGRIIIRVDPALFRPLEVENLLGDPSKARMRLQWQCATPFSETVKELVESELKLLAPAHATRLRLYE